MFTIRESQFGFYYAGGDLFSPLKKDAVKFANRASAQEEIITGKLSDVVRSTLNVVAS